MDKEEITVKIKQLSDKGEGLVDHAGFQIYVKGVVPGDKVLIERLSPFVKGSKRCPGKLLKILERSPDRANDEEICPYVQDCGGCPLGLLHERAQHAYKQKLIDEALTEAGFSNFKQRTFIGSPKGVLRSKSIRFFAQGKDGIYQGFYQSRSHSLCAVQECPVEQDWFGQLAANICTLATKHGINAYHELKHEGSIRALMMRDCAEGGRIAVLSHAMPLTDAFLEDLTLLYAKFKIRAGFHQLNQDKGNRILHGTMIPLTKESCIQVKIGDYSFSAGPNTFLQVNYAVAQKLYAAALQWCGEDHEANALDLCCGCGTMTLPLAKQFKHVTGVEIVEEAVKAAKLNAQKAKLTNVEFIADDLKRCLPNLTKDNIVAVIADPARTGLGKSNCHALKHLPSGTRLALIFCGLKALSRDISELVKVGFTLEAVQGFDMFPKSLGCETLCLMRKV